MNQTAPLRMDTSEEAGSNEHDHLTAYDDAESYEYDVFVSHLADSKSDQLISNGQIPHARSIIRNLFSHAEKEIRIFTSCLNSRIYSDPKIFGAATAFLSNADARLSILLQDSDNLDSEMPLLELCKGNPQCDVREIVNKNDQEIKQHMVVMDNIGYRFCPDKCQKTAIASFNAPAIAKNLATQFDILFGRARQYSLEAVAQ